MALSRKHFAALAEAIGEHNAKPLCRLGKIPKFEIAHLAVLADWLEEQNPNFDREKWRERVEREELR